MSVRYPADVAGATAQHCWETLTDGNLGKHFSGEHRLPACPSRQLAEMHLSMLLREEEIRDTDVAGRLPATTGWQPVLPGWLAVTR
jgi:hypothetical protein